MLDKRIQTFLTLQLLFAESFSSALTPRGIDDKMSRDKIAIAGVDDMSLPKLVSIQYTPTHLCRSTSSACI